MNGTSISAISAALRMGRPLAGDFATIHLLQKARRNCTTANSANRINSLEQHFRTGFIQKPHRSHAETVARGEI
jgi:hypothetical protein